MVGPQSLACLRDRARGRDVPFFLPCSGELQARHEEAHHLLVRVAEEQAQGEHVIDHDPRGQQTGPLFRPPRLREHFIDQVTVDKAGQDANANPVRQPETRSSSPDIIHSVTISEQQEEWKRKIASASYPQILGRVAVDLLIPKARNLN